MSQDRITEPQGQLISDNWDWAIGQTKTFLGKMPSTRNITFNQPEWTNATTNALIKAATKFDASKSKFRTYAAKLIKFELINLMRASRPGFSRHRGQFACLHSMSKKFASHKNGHKVEWADLFESELSRLEQIRESKEEFYNLIGCLSGKDRLVMIMIYLMDFTMTRVAEEFGVTPQAISQRHKKILGILREELETSAA